MGRLKSLLIAAPIAAGLLAAPAAHAEWRGHGGGWGGHGDWHGGGWHGDGWRGGGPLVGALVGLGAAAVIGGLIASQPVYAAPPPVVYAPPPPPYGYYPAPVYAAPPAYYVAPPRY